MYKTYIKRLLDIIFTFIAIILLSPILIIIAISIRIKLGNPVIFKQKRPGQHGEIFLIYKFRTMINAYDKQGVLLPDELRLNKFGKFLRSTSLDELPELFNIIKGEMSIIGPRPLLVKYLPLYNETQKHRHDVKPGLTGLAQVNGRNAITWESKFNLDLHYIQHISLYLDIKIFFLTFIKVFKRDDITSETSATMEEFTGCKN